MKETRKIRIQNKVISKKDLERMNNIFLIEYNKSLDCENMVNFNFKCSFSDKTSTESDVPFNNSDFLDMKKAVEIYFIFRDFSENKSIQLRINHGDNSSYNEIEISAKDEIWIGYISDLFEKLIESIKEQNIFFTKHQKIIIIISSVIIGLNIFEFGLTPLIHFLFGTLSDSGKIIMAGLSTSITSFLLIHPLLKKLIELWPEIEFDFGPDHKKIEKLRRIRISLISSLIIIPTIINIIFLIISKF